MKVPKNRYLRRVKTTPKLTRIEEILTDRVLKRLKQRGLPRPGVTTVARL